LVHPDDRAATQAEVGKLAEGAETILFENRYRHQDGSYRWLQWTARPVPGRQLVYASARDVTRQKQLEREILDITDREQERLGRELHDGLCQTLAGIAALSAALSRRLGAELAVASAAAAEITALLNEAIGEARDLARGFGPVGLRATGLAGALEGLALTVQHRFRVACTLEGEEPFPRLGHEVEAHLFRIAQEAVHNAVTHARTDRIEISLSANGEGRLRVRDEGVGLPDAALRGDGSGLHTMAYRARLIGGSLEVGRRTPAGTTITCVFPLPATSDTGEDLDHAHTDS
jgi:signal transduction histidine kinase